ncbi:type IX secretion system anionic LPS delivery protein PorZ [Viscerimonas tarda]
MKKPVFILLLSIVSCTALFSQKIGEWNTYFSYEKDIANMVQAGNIIYAVSDGKLFSYDTSDESMETYAKIGEDSISHIAYSEKNECLVVVRKNSDVDFIYSKGRMTNISDIKNMSFNLDKTINDLIIDDDFVYISTNFGLVILDIPRREVKGSALFRYPFYSTVMYNDKIYVLTSNGTFRIDKGLNIQYPDSWESVNLASNYSGLLTFSDNEIRKAVAFDNKLVFLVPSKALYSYNGTSVEQVSQVSAPKRILGAKNRLIVSNSSGFWDFSALNFGAAINNMPEQFEYIIPDNTKSNEYWVSFKDKQLSAIKIEQGSPSVIKSAIRPNGPTSNYHFNMIYEQGRLLSVGGSATNRPSRYPAQLNEYKGNTWFQFSKEEIDDISGIDSKDFVRVTVDPSDPGHVFVTAFGGTGANGNAKNGGVYEFKDRQFVRLHNHTNTPCIETAAGAGNPNVVLMNGQAFDQGGNLWLQNPLLTNNSIVVRKKDGSWVSLHYNEIAQKNTNPRSILVDKYGNKWSATYNAESYIFVFNEGQAAIENTVAHSTKLALKTQFADQDGQLLSDLKLIYCITEDKNGNIWLGSDIGLFVIYNSPQIFNRNIVFNKIKVPKNDGTNEANILLENAVVQDIKVDGANRKWIATSSGLYVVSANGMETYHYFTKENSVLPSNNILSLAIDQQTGVVYIGTDNGLVSYKGEATEGAKDYSNVYAYPNPVRPEYDGPITISGLKEKSTVKITDVRGNLIQQGESLGGQYIWDGRNTRKEKVATGVYLVFGSSEDGQEGVVTKIMVVSN